MPALARIQNGGCFLTVDQEKARRQEMWASVSKDGHDDLEPALVRALGIYGGAQGIWVDLARTGSLATNGVAVGILHTGRHYADDLSDDGLIYHYPQTNRPPARDAAEVQSLKNAKDLGLPIFVISPGKRTVTRSVDVGWVLDFDDEARQFLISFGQSASPPIYVPPPTVDAPFELEGTQERRNRSVLVRPGQQRFRFQVIERYGCKCAVCDISHPSLVEAAHIRGKGDRGSDDWRNGLPFCSTHHAAFDGLLFAIDPTTHEIKSKAGVAPQAVGLKVARLSVVRNAPHTDALLWRWEDTLKKWGV